MKTASAVLALVWAIPVLGGGPAVSDERLVVELVAREPQVFTPTGIAVDKEGRIFVIENHTHFRPKDYQGPPGDRVLVMDQFTADGRAGRIVPFVEGLKDSMSLTVRDGGVYLVTRNAVTFIADDGGKAGARKTLARLETAADYPHNGLNGVAFSPSGEMYFALGLNVGRSYTLVGSDGTSVSGGGEGGSMYRCKPDGTGLSQVATGFWNVHDLTFDAFGRLFAVDNDPDDRPPCRLLDIIEGGDYGWQYRNGRKGIHPFTSWFGERIGTLPMISPIGEAPSGIISYQSDGLPAEYRGRLIGTSWGDHVVQQFDLKPKGASVISEPKPLVTGGQDFRPVGIAVAPDGSLVISDWVDKSYAVHGKGRVWRVRGKEPSSNGAPMAALMKPPFWAYREAIGAMPSGTWPAAGDGEWAKAREDRFVQSAAITALSHGGRVAERVARLPVHEEIERIIELLAVRRSGEGIDRLPEFLKDPRPGVRRAALQWVGEERLKQFGDLVSESLKAGPVTRDVLMAAVAVRDKLSSEPPAPGKPPVEYAGGALAVEFVFDASLDWDVRRLALHLSDPLSPKLSPARVRPMLADLGNEAVRVMAWREDAASQSMLREIAVDESRPESWRLEAIAGLVRSAATPATHETLLSFLHHSPHAVQLEALRSLRGSLNKDEIGEIAASFDTALAKPGLAGDPMWHEWAEQVLLAAKAAPGALSDQQEAKLRTIAGERPRDEQAWQAFLAQGGNVEAGRRVFSHPNAARCFVCHAVEGRGGMVGPDLTGAGGSLSRQKIVESILFPSREIAPMYVPVVLTLKDGSSVTGVGLEEVGANAITLRDAAGKLVKVSASDVVSRRLEKLSIMPEGLPDAMTPGEFRDVVEFLSRQK